MPHIRPDVRDGVSESVFRSRGNYYREKYFWIDPHEIPKWVGSSRWKETALWSEHDEDIRDKMQEARVQARIFRLDVCREVKCNCLHAGRHLCNNSTGAISIVLLFGFKKLLFN